MKNFKLIIAALGVAGSLATAAQAADLAAYRGQSIDLGNVKGIAFYTEEKDGYRVVTTLADADSKSVRFEAVLAAGQTIVLSSPAALGEVPMRIEISRKGDRVQVQEIPVTN